MKVKKKKKLKRLKVVIPLFLGVVLFIFIFNYHLILNFIDNQIINCQYICDDGWTLKNNMCYQEQKYSKPKVKAYIIGDLDGSSLINQKDYDVMLRYLNEPEQLNHKNILIYDINQDNEINEQDLNELKSLIAKSEKDVQYVCSDKLIQKLNDKNNTTIITTYMLKNAYCNIQIIERIEKKASQKCNDISTKYDILKYHN